MSETKQSTKARKATTTRAAHGKTSAKSKTSTKSKTSAKRPTATSLRELSARSIKIEVTEELRHQMIAEAAYFLAERRDFEHGDPTRDWFEAELAISRRLAERTPAGGAGV